MLFTNFKHFEVVLVTIIFISVCFLTAIVVAYAVLWTVKKSERPATAINDTRENMCYCKDEEDACNKTHNFDFDDLDGPSRYIASISAANLTVQTFCCSGVIIDRDTVLTASKCFREIAGKGYSFVRVGSKSWMKRGSVHKVVGYSVFRTHSEEPILMKITPKISYRYQIQAGKVLKPASEADKDSKLFCWKRNSTDKNGNFETDEINLEFLAAEEAIFALNDTCQSTYGHPIFLSESLLAIKLDNINPELAKFIKITKDMETWIRNNTQR